MNLFNWVSRNTLYINIDEENLEELFPCYENNFNSVKIVKKVIKKECLDLKLKVEHIYKYTTINQYRKPFVYYKISIEKRDELNTYKLFCSNVFKRRHKKYKKYKKVWFKSCWFK